MTMTHGMKMMNNATPTPGDLSTRLPELPEETDFMDGCKNACCPVHYGYTADQMRAYAIAALSALPAAGEPVGEVLWSTRNCADRFLHTFVHDVPIPDGTKLYTTPQPSAAEEIGPHPLNICPKCKDYYMECECPADAAVGAQGEGRWIKQTTFYDPANPDACTGNCTEAAVASILGLRLDEVPALAGKRAPEFWPALDAFIESRGFDLHMMAANYVPAGMYLASGQSERGCSHMVVMQDGNLLHDPHPSRAGIKSVEYVWMLVPKDPAIIRRLAAPAAGKGVDGVSLADIHLAAQMLTWGRDEGLTDKQEAEVDAHAQKLFAALTRQPAPSDDDLPGMWSHSDFTGGDPDERSHHERTRQPVAGDGGLPADDVKWIVNDLAELGVMIRGQAFFLYKGESLVYKNGTHDDGTPMLYRMVGKREFGECCHPVKFYRDDARLPGRYTEQLVYTPGLSAGKPEDGDWKPLPAAPAATPTDGGEGKS